MDTNTSIIPFKILLVDDEVSILRIVKSILTKAMYTVRTCESGSEAFDVLSAEHFDCVITDAMMPLMTGYDLVKKIRQSELSHLPVLMLTRKRHRHDVKKAVEVGITDYILKPVDEHLLLDKVELALRKGTGKRHIFESAVNGKNAEVSITVPCTALTLSESAMTAQVPMELNKELNLGIGGSIFEEIGIQAPFFKMISCSRLEHRTPQGNQYEATFAFVGVPEQDLKKIRNWLNREEIRRRK